MTTRKAALRFKAKTPYFTSAKGLPVEERLTRSPYYWWYEFLKRHEGYRRTCANGGVGKFASLYKDFGDVHALDFKTWWYRIGTTRFSEKENVHTLDLVTDFDEAKNYDKKEVIVITVPLDWRKTALVDKFKRIVDKYYVGKAEIKKQDSNADYKIEAKRVSVKSLQKTLLIWDLKNSLPAGTQLWKIGEAAGISPKLNSSKTTEIHDIQSRREKMSIVVSRYLKQANSIIEHAAMGKFPIKQTSC